MRDKKLYLSAKMQILKCIQLWTIAQKGNKVSLHFIELIHLRLYSQKRTLWPLLNLIWKLYGTYFRCNICRHVWCDSYLDFVHISIIENLDIYFTHIQRAILFLLFKKFLSTLNSILFVSISYITYLYKLLMSIMT